jgi:hypothetical protein
MVKLTPPNWCPDAIPTTRGWVRGKELLKSQRISQSDIDEFNKPNIVEDTKVVEKPKRKRKKKMKNEDKVMLHEAPVGNKTLDEMTEEQKEALKETTNNSGEILTE